MVTVNDAKQKIIMNAGSLSFETKTVESALGYVLANDVLAPISLPSFRQSSMDGYALDHSDLTKSGISLRIISESKAGESLTKSLQNGEAIRIFTGAPVPIGATAVVMQEHTQKKGDIIIIEEYPVNAGQNVREIGQQIKQGSVALSANTLLSPGSIGFLLGMNVQNVDVYRKPKVGLLVTGDELITNGQTLAFGQVYESNSSMLVAALQQEGIFEITVTHSSDNLESTVEALEFLAIENDIVLATGGVSVGDYDFVGKALEVIGAETVFYKVKQKPGKPLLFAKRENKLFFALPGNPASSLVCYYEYVLPAIRKITGRTNSFLRSQRMPITASYKFNGERDEFLKAIATNDFVTPLDGQESFALRSFGMANAIIYLPVTQNTVEKGDLVEVHLLPG